MDLESKTNEEIWALIKECEAVLTARLSGTVLMKHVAQSVARDHRIEFRDLMGTCRRRDYAWPRQEAMWRMNELGRFSLPRIGAFFNRHHTTVLHAIRAHSRRMEASGG